MKILWFTWKDSKHPAAGGAELVNEELAKRLVQDGHEVIFIVAKFGGAARRDEQNGFRIIRLGSEYRVYPAAGFYYRRHLCGWADVVIEEVNTIPFFTRYYVKEPKVLFFHQLCRRIWLYQQPFPFSVMGYLAEPFYLRLINDLPVITVSQSTRNDLLRYGFNPARITVINEGNPLQERRITDLERVEKYPEVTLLSLGASRRMKRVEHQVQAFEIAKTQVSELSLIVAGRATQKQRQKIKRLIQQSRFSKDIKYLGSVSTEKKIELMQRAHLILETSVKEGWGLTVTEAASQGTPAIAYNVDGLRDSVQHNQTGLVVEERPEALAWAILRLIRDPALYQRLRVGAWQQSQKFTFGRSYKDFLQAVERVF